MIVDLEEYFTENVIRFYRRHGRKFYWRTNHLDSFQWLITEVFLRKTRAENVEGVLVNFLKKYKDFMDIYEAEERAIIDEISILGLGKQRAVTLKKISHIVLTQYNGQLPDLKKNLEKIYGIGMYISNAILCFCYGKHLPVIDVNVSRVVTRFFNLGKKKDLRNNKELTDFCTRLLPTKNVKEYNWGLLDFGALICKPKPICKDCFLKTKCNTSPNKS